MLIPQLTSLLGQIYKRSRNCAPRTSSLLLLDRGCVSALHWSACFLTDTLGKMAAIYGLPSEPIGSPRHTPTRVIPTTPVRSSESLSPSASSGPMHWLDYPAAPVAAPPTKRRRVTRVTTTGGVGAGASPASAILLDDAEERISTPPSSPLKREQNGDIPRHMINVCTTLAKASTWKDEVGRYICGFCAYVSFLHKSCCPGNNAGFSLHNSVHKRDRRPPLTFDPSQYPITFWKHCLMLHKDALKPGIEAWIKVEGSKLSVSFVLVPCKSCHLFGRLQESSLTIDLPALLANFISWKSEGGNTCGLCA